MGAKFFAINVASGGLAGAGSLMIVYPLDYARTRLASDVGGKERQFNGLVDCLKKTVQAGGIGSVYNGIVSLLWVSSHTVEHISVFSIPSPDTILTKNQTIASCVLHPNSSAHKPQLSLLVTYHTHSIPYGVGFKCNLRNLRANGFTKVLLTASAR